MFNVDRKSKTGQKEKMSIQKFNLSIGRRVRKLRRENDMTQDDLSKSSGISRSAIASIETGRQAMTAYQVFLLGKALKLKNMSIMFELPDIENSESEIEINIVERTELNEAQQKQVESIFAKS